MLQEITQYFKSREGFGRLLGLMYDVYGVHGRVFGAVRLTNPAREEETAVSEFFNRDYYNQALIRIALADFERQIHNVFSSQVQLGEFLENYHAKTSNKNALHKPGDFSHAVLEILPKFENTHAEVWLKEIAAQTRKTYRAWADRHSSAPAAVLKEITNVAAAINNLPIDTGPPIEACNASYEYPSGKKLVPLAEFLQGYGLFDFSGISAQLFQKALACRYQVPAPAGTEDDINLHLRGGILANGFSSSVTVRGISAVTHDGKKDLACEYYNNLNQAHVLTLENLSRFKSCEAHDCKAFVTENPVSFSTLIQHQVSSKNTLILAGAQNFSAAFMYLAKLLKAANVTFCYSGEFNSKSLERADKLYLQYGRGFKPWRYNIEAYTQILKDKTSILPDEKTLPALHNEELASLLSYMRKVGKTASSLPLLPQLISDYGVPLYLNS
ncbi:MAG: TIGR02679 domain-containing protein [Defluviitaleaceae bacterium]|nr:TIGR02679 domain-containing protein [Defluviitaleaceae bacterium]